MLSIITQSGLELETVPWNYANELTKDTAHKTASYLQNKGYAGRDVVLLGQPQILSKQCGLGRSVVCKASEIEVRKGTTREEVACKHLTNGLNVEAKSCDT